jgi:hypothetical protein
MQNLELVQYVVRLHDENDELRDLMGWLSGQEPQLGMMIAAFKHFEGQAFGSEKVGESGGEKK